MSLLLARAMWKCPIPQAMTASSGQGITGASRRKTGRRDCKSRTPSACSFVLHRQRTLTLTCVWLKVCLSRKTSPRRGNFTRDDWNYLLCLFDISHFSSINGSGVMSKTSQKDSGEERVTAKSKPMMNLVSRCSERTRGVLLCTASESWGKSDMKIAN